MGAHGFSTTPSERSRSVTCPGAQTSAAPRARAGASDLYRAGKRCAPDLYGGGEEMCARFVRGRAAHVVREIDRDVAVERARLDVRVHHLHALGARALSVRANKSTRHLPLSCTILRYLALSSAV